MHGAHSEEYHVWLKGVVPLDVWERIEISVLLWSKSRKNHHYLMESFENAI